MRVGLGNGRQAAGLVQADVLALARFGGVVGCGGTINQMVQQEFDFVGGGEFAVLLVFGEELVGEEDLAVGVVVLQLVVQAAFTQMQCAEAVWQGLAVQVAVEQGSANGKIVGNEFADFAGGQQALGVQPGVRSDRRCPGGAAGRAGRVRCWVVRR